MRILSPLTAAEKKEARDSAEAFWNGDAGQAVRKASRCYPELPFIYKTPYGILKGQIDLVFQTSKGEWVILDYKTNRVTAQTLPEVAAGYEWQLALYALIFQRLYGEAPGRGVLYFSALSQAHETSYRAVDFKAFEERLIVQFRAMAEHQSA